MNSITDNFYFRMEINQATKPKLESTNKNKNDASIDKLFDLFFS